MHCRLINTGLHVVLSMIHIQNVPQLNPNRGQ